MSKPSVLVLMTTYNGASYLHQQIDSVLAQEDVEVTLVVRDDASTDGTWDILQQYAAEHTNVAALRNDPNLGCIRNFMGLVYACDADAYDFYALCDQDDVWLPNKLAAAVAAVGADAASSEQAVLYYADVCNVDERGEEMGCEYAPYRTCAEHYGSLLLVQNWCLGCTTLMNGALVRKLQEHPVYDFKRMYDAWIHAVALYTGGRVVCDLEHSYIKRRITESNTVGVMNQKRSAGFIARKAFGWLLSKDQETAEKHTALAACLLREFGDQMDADTRQLVSDVAMREQSRSARARLAARGDIVMTTPLRTKWLQMMLRLNRF